MLFREDNFLPEFASLLKILHRLTLTSFFPFLWGDKERGGGPKMDIKEYEMRNIKNDSLKISEKSPEWKEMKK